MLLRLYCYITIAFLSVCYQTIMHTYAHRRLEVAASTASKVRERRQAKLQDRFRFRV